VVLFNSIKRTAEAEETVVPELVATFTTKLPGVNDVWATTVLPKANNRANNPVVNFFIKK
jgi:hypothetical protein